MKSRHEDQMVRLVAAFASTIHRWSDIWNPSTSPVNAITGRPYTGLHRLLLVPRSDARYVATSAQIAAHGLMTHGTPVDLFTLKQNKTEQRSRFLTPHHFVTVTPVEDTDVRRKTCYDPDPKTARHVLKLLGGDVPPAGYDDLVLRAIVGRSCDTYDQKVKLYRKDVVEEIAVAFVMHAFGYKPFLTNMDGMEEEVGHAEENPLYVVHDLFSAYQVMENTVRLLHAAP